MASIPELLESNLHRVFGAKNDDDRHTAVLETYADQVTFTDPEGTSVGIRSVEARARALSEAAPADFRFIKDGPVYVGDHNGAQAWALGPEGGEPVARGIDFVTVESGKITSVITLLTEMSKDV
ncbi:nuclear transport factor 2 family protein [Lacisediminihabitans sp. G11-30]|uniref:Nuclear transport factor 2 family protein n=2 Tax=Lacisediminihabitans changchengi TaxID=2787634 RepID=A0A934W3N3_9MICO|nr:nuclear transport factor 2 family protein [Lacisediminihabitans changchengi]